jgi:hypothetical protein
VRWDDLFADLEGQLEEAERAELAVEVADRTRLELGRVTLVDRLRAALDRPVGVELRGAGSVTGRLLEVGPDWLLLEERREVLVPLAALLVVTGLPARVAAPLPEARARTRVRLATALRGLVRERAPVAVTLVDGTLLQGTLDRVGADHVDLALHEPGEARRPGALRGVRVLPVPALGAVRSA